MKIFNEFGIKPTTNCKAAGYDFYIPNIKVPIDNCDYILNAFSASYKKTKEELTEILNNLVLYATAQYGEKPINGNELNILFLYLALDSTALHVVDDPYEIFIDHYLIFDEKNNVPGIKPRVLDHVFFNSGIHVALEPNTVGIFFNKSGRGIKGWDIRACVIDEDYAGAVHLSLAYTKLNDDDGIIYCGDKLTQMVVLPVLHSEIEEVEEEDYNEIMSNSERGSNAFGSSDEKH